MLAEVFQKAAQHVLVRFSDRLSTAPEDGTIEEHTKIIKKKGYVWMGKFGRNLGKNHIAVLLSQIKKTIPTYLILVQVENKEYDVHIAPLLDITTKITKADLESVPPYYRKNLVEIGSWFKINKFQKISGESLKSILISSSGMPASTTLKASMAGAFIVRLSKNVAFKDLIKK